jgi:hypothetical protein
LVFLAFSLFLPVAQAIGDGASTPREWPLTQALLTVGTQYQRGGNSPGSGFDCSGLVAHVFQKAWGILLPRTVRE